MEIFTYDLPADRIAERPVVPYDSAKLLRVSRRDLSLADHRFFELRSFIGQGDLLVLNNTMVKRSRLFGTLVPGGGEMELLLLEKVGEGRYRAWGRPARKLSAGRLFRIDNLIDGEVLERVNDRELVIKLEVNDGSLDEALQRSAMMPIPPYIRGGRADKQDDRDYQTLFASNPGSVAAPTASLHFTPKLLQLLQEDGVEIRFLTLHVGPASFAAVVDQAGHYSAPQSESFDIPSDVKERIQSVRSQGGRVIACGTTVVRALESLADGRSSGQTDLFIRPGFRFRYVDSLITNFHQPGTTHLLLVEALLGRELLSRSYSHALENDYRFLSYGDAMLIE